MIVGNCLYTGESDDQLNSIESILTEDLVDATHAFDAAAQTKNLTLASLKYGDYWNLPFLTVRTKLALGIR